jgi:ferredoxin
VYDTNEFHSTVILRQDCCNERRIVADKNLRSPENVPGKFYVDSTCIDCDVCRNTAPQFFNRFDEGGYTVVYRQPQTAEEIALAKEALDGCPTDSIGEDGE